MTNWINRPADGYGPAYSFATIDRGAPWDAGVRLRHTIECSGEEVGASATWSADVVLPVLAAPGAIADPDGRAIVHGEGTAPTLLEAKAGALAFVQATDTETIVYDVGLPVRRLRWSEA